MNVLLLIVTLLIFFLGVQVLLSGTYQVMGKQPVYGIDARLIGALFVLPFVVQLFDLALSARLDNSVPALDALTVVLLLAGIGVLIYTAFFTPDRSLDRTGVGGGNLPETVTTAIAAAYLHIPEEEVVALIKSGKLQARKAENGYRIHKEVLIGYRQTKMAQEKPDQPL